MEIQPPEEVNHVSRNNNRKFFKINTTKDLLRSHSSSREANGIILKVMKAFIEVNDPANWETHFREVVINEKTDEFIQRFDQELDNTCFLIVNTVGIPFEIQMLFNFKTVPQAFKFYRSRNVDIINSNFKTYSNLKVSFEWLMSNTVDAVTMDLLILAAVQLITFKQICCNETELMAIKSQMKKILLLMRSVTKPGVIDYFQNIRVDLGKYFLSDEEESRENGT